MTSSSKTEWARPVAGVVSAAGSLLLALLWWKAWGLRTATPGLTDLYALGRGDEAVMVLAMLLVMPVGALLQTPLALARRARVG
ncbi:hypothetical protein G5C51_25875, partial [Streptomyces sp. A7024]